MSSDSLPAPPVGLPVTWEADGAVVTLRPQRPDRTALGWLVFEGSLLWLGIYLVLGALLLGLTVALTVRGGSTVLVEQVLLHAARAAVPTWLALVVAFLARGWRRKASLLRARCTSSALELRWRLGPLPTRTRRLELADIVGSRALRLGPRQIPALQLRLRGAGSLTVPLRGNTIAEVRWLVGLIGHARQRSAAFWRDELRRDGAQREAAEALVARRAKGRRAGPEA